MKRSCFLISVSLPHTHVSLFKRIFNFEPIAVKKMELRLNTRYKPGAGFPLEAGLILADGKTWPAKVLDMSGNGLGLEVAPAAPLVEKAPVKVHLKFGQHEQVLDAKLIQVRPSRKGAYCGIGLKFADFITQKTYLQLLQPVAIGQSLEPVAPELVIQNEPQFTKQVFRGDEESVLTVWAGKDAPHALHSFEFQMHDYFCHVDGKSGVLEAYQREDSGSHKGKLSHPVFDISGSLHAEIRQLFRWILPNLSRRVPEDIRAFLQRFAT